MTEQTNKKTLKNISSTFYNHLKCTLRDLNLYDEDPFWSPNLKYYEQIISTRLFAVFLFISLLIVLIYASSMNVNYEVTLDHFTLADFEKYEQLYPQTIHAPCNEVSIPYNQFLNISPIFHEVCSSVFVRQTWISSLFLLNATSHNILDYRTFAFSHFRALNLLCRTARQAVRDAHRTFNFTNLITGETFSREQFNEVSSVLFNNFQQDLLTNKRKLLDLLSIMTSENNLISALRTNRYYTSEPGSREYFTYNGVYLYPNQSDEITCDCRHETNQCFFPAGAFYNWTKFDISKPAKNDPPPKFQIPGLMAGCLPLDSIQRSTLECLYNQSCVDAIILKSITRHPRALNHSLTRFPLNSTVGSMFNQSLFVESWQNKSSFENYYKTCSPQSLSYSYQKRFDIGTIVTLTLSAFSGLMIGLKLVTPLCVKLFRLFKKRKQTPPTNTHTQIELAITKLAPKRFQKAVVHTVHRTIYNFNLFPSSNPDDERIGIISTRLYIFLIIFGLIILAIYTIITQHNQINTISHPSMTQFEDLHRRYSSTLRCPCTHFSMSYGRIMSTEPTFHSICSSEFIRDYWLEYFGRVEIDVEEFSFIPMDFRINGASFFHLIQMLCKTSNKTIENAIRLFKTNRLVTVNALSSRQFAIQTQTRLKSFENQTISSVNIIIQLISSAIRTNQLAQDMWTNMRPVSTFDNQTSQWSLHFKQRDFYTNQCSCELFDHCTRPSGFYLQEHDVYDQPTRVIPGLVISCFPIDSLLFSTLECFYNQTCIQSIIDNYDFDVVDLVHPLNSEAKAVRALPNTTTTRFHPNTTIQEILAELFVEDWNRMTNYTAYYSRCQPKQCTYTVKKRFDFAHMTALMLGFCGGLSAVLDICLPWIVGFFLKKKKVSKQKQPDVYTITTEQISSDLESTKIKRKKQSLIEKFLSLNCFQDDDDDEKSSTNERLIHQERVSTRIYLVLLVLSLIGAYLFYGPFSQEIKTQSILNPSISQIKELHQQNIPTLSCPCSTVAMRYIRFLSIQTDFHPICSSKYVSPSYLLELYNNSTNVSSPLVTHYRTLAALCFLSKKFIEHKYHSFNQRELITVETLTNESFTIEIQSLVSSFIRQTKADYRRQLSFIMNSFSVNQILNLFMNSWNIKFSDAEHDYVIDTIPQQFPLTNCTCAISRQCQMKYTDDIRIGCFPYDGFRLSKHENQSLEKLNMDLFVTKWNNQTNYTNYFRICRPLECQYTESDRNNLLYIATNLLGIYGGLVTLLTVIVSQFLLAYKWWTTF